MVKGVMKVSLVDNLDVSTSLSLSVSPDASHWNWKVLGVSGETLTQKLGTHV
jgi:hypothetical protein